MKVKNWVACALAVACAMVASSAAAALDDKPAEGSKGSAFKSAVFAMKQKGEVAVLLTSVAGKEVTVTTNGEKETDVNLFIHDGDKNEIGKDTSPGPKCEVKFTPKTDGTFKLLVKNKGPEPNNVTLEVKVAESDDKPADGGKGSAFKSAVFEMKEKGEVAVLRTFAADKAVTVTTNGDKETDVHLFIHDGEKNEVGKDTSPGPKCEVKFTPKTEGTYKLLVKNKGPGPNNVTLEVKVSE
jgi:hypothetical protein